MSDKLKKQILAAHQHLINQGLNPSDIAREQRYDLMMPKLALVGVLQTMETFCAAGKANVMSTVGPLNTQNLMLFLGAMKKSIEMGEKILTEYQETQSTIHIMEQTLATVEQEATEQHPDDDDNPDAQEQETEDDEDTDNPDDKSQEEFLKTFDIRKLN